MYVIGIEIRVTHYARLTAVATIRTDAVYLEQFSRVNSEVANLLQLEL